MNRLWTKDYTLITLGTIISMLGNAVASFAIGLVVYDLTNSTLLFAIYTTVTIIPKIIVPLLVGPIVDRFSRKKIIVILDYFSSVIFLSITLLFYFGVANNYILFLFLGFLLGSVDSFYNVTYESFYPTLISKGCYSKAYSIGSMISPIATTVMVPIAANVYDGAGVEVLFIFNAISFFITASIEIFISKDKKDEEKKTYNFKMFKSDFVNGLDYVKHEKGLKSIIGYFFVTTLTGAVVGALLLPFFVSTDGYTKQDYSYLMAIGTLGRVIGALFHYKHEYKKDNRFKIAAAVYTSVVLLRAIMLFTPFVCMLIFQLMIGLLAVTSYTIRISSTQSYVPNERRGRFNSVFMMITNIGAVIGQLIGGVLGEFLYIPYIIVAFMILDLLAIFFIVIGNKKSISLIYNNEI